jgi:hypothetical protein
MKIAQKDGKPCLVLRPKDPDAAVAHALKCKDAQIWEQYPGETKFVGYLAEMNNPNAAPFVLDKHGNKIGHVERGDVFATEASN